MDEEVAKTLGDLELKLRELEQELASIGGSRPHAEQAGRVVDEAIEPSTDPSPGFMPPGPQSQAPPSGFAPAGPPPPVAQAPVPPSPPGPPDEAPPSAPPPRVAPPPPAAPTFEPRETIEQRYSLQARETIYGEIPATKDRQQEIDLDELVRFGETLKRTFGDLIDQYSRLLADESSQTPESRH